MTFEDIKAGDTVGVRSGYAGPARPVKVERVTKLHIIVAGGMKFRRTSGSNVGAHRWGSPALSRWTPASAEEWKDWRNRTLCGDYRWKDAPASLCAAVAELIRKHAPTEAQR